MYIFCARRAESKKRIVQCADGARWARYIVDTSKKNVRHKQKGSLTFQNVQNTFRWDFCSWKVLGNPKSNFSRYRRFRMSHCSISVFCQRFFLRLKRCWLNRTISFSRAEWCWMLHYLLPKMFKTNYIHDGLVCKGGGCFLLKCLHILYALVPW